jgi:hypothetical protein
MQTQTQTSTPPAQVFTSEFTVDPALVGIEGLELPPSVVQLWRFCDLGTGSGIARPDLKGVNILFKKDGSLEACATNGHYMVIVKLDPIQGQFSKAGEVVTFRGAFEGEDRLADVRTWLDGKILKGLNPKKSDRVLLTKISPTVRSSDSPHPLSFSVHNGVHVYNEARQSIVRDNFPDYNAVVPHNFTPISGIGLNPAYLGIFADYLKKIGCRQACKLQFSREDGPMLIEAPVESISGEFKGDLISRTNSVELVLMPMRF